MSIFVHIDKPRHMKALVKNSILTALLIGIAALLSLSSCTGSSDKEKMREALQLTNGDLPMKVDDDITWVAVRYDESANVVIFEYTSRVVFPLSENDKQLIHTASAASVLDSEPAESVALFRRLKPDVRYIYRYTKDNSVWLEDTLRPDEYLYK